VADGSDQAQCHQFIGQEAQRPAAATLRWVAAGHADQFLLDVPLDLDLVGPGGLGPRADGGLEALGHEALADAAAGEQAGAQRVDDFLVGLFLPRGIGQQEDAGMGKLARRGFADSDQLFQARTLLRRQGNLVLGHGGTPSPEGLTVASALQLSKFQATYQSKSADLLGDCPRNGLQNSYSCLL
jgi:hypothetical protein